MSDFDNLLDNLLDALKEAENSQLVLASDQAQKASATEGQERNWHSTMSEKYRHAAHCIRMCMDHQQAVIDRWKL